MNGVLERAQWWVQDYAYAASRQVLGLASGVKPETFHSGNERPVLVIPGIYENWHFMLPLITAVHQAGHPVHVVTVLQWNRKSVPEGARLVADHLASQDLRDVVLLAHSKGGLIGKFAMMGMNGDKRIDRMIAVCSPFSGSRYARFMLAPSLRAFSPLNAITVQMAREQNVNQHISSVFGTFDPHIPEGSVLPGARNIKLDVAGHFRILGHEDTVRTILKEIKLP